MDSDKQSPEQWRLEDMLKYLDVDDEHEAEEILHSILTSTEILTGNGRGEIVYRGHNIRGTNIVDLLKYCVTPYHPDIPEPTGLSIFIKGLAELEIAKSLIVNGRVFTVLAHKWSRQDT
jgi:hypothetical protein